MRDEQGILTMFVDMIFPDGNLRWYVLFVPSAALFMWTAYVTVTIILFLIYGTTIQTDTFVAHMDYSIPKISPYIQGVISRLLDVFSWVWTVFAVYLGSSVIIDFTRGMFQFIDIIFAYLDGVHR